MAPPRSAARSCGAAARTLRRPGHRHRRRQPSEAGELLAVRLFGKQQLSSLMDYIQGSIMLNYNDRAL